MQSRYQEGRGTCSVRRSTIARCRCLMLRSTVVSNGSAASPFVIARARWCLGNAQIKTGCSFAVWGQAEMGPLAKSARHKNPKDAAMYLQDSDTQLELAKFDPEMRAVIDLMLQWRPIHIENLSQAAARAGKRRDEYIAAKIIVDPATNLGPLEQLNELLATNVAPNVAAKLQRIVGRPLLDAVNGRALRADQIRRRRQRYTICCISWRSTRTR